MAEEYALNIPGHDVVHLPCYGRHGRRTWCGRANVEAALDRANDAGQQTFRLIQPRHRACKNCIASVGYMLRNLNDKLTALGEPPLGGEA